MRHLTTRLVLGAALLAQATACGSCRGRGQGPTDPVERLPANAAAAVSIHDLKKLGAVVAAAQNGKLAGLAASAAGVQNPEELLGPIVQQLGFDPRRSESFKEVGLSGSLAAANDGVTDLVVLGVSDGGKAEAWVAGVAARAGAPVRAEQKAPGGITVKTFSPQGGEPLLAYALAGSHLVAARGPDAAGVVARAASRKPEESLAQNPAFVVARQKLGPRDVLLFNTDERIPGALGLTIDSGGLQLRALLRRPPQTLASMKGAVGSAGGELVGRLSPRDFLAVRLGGDPATLMPLIETALPQRMRERLAQAGIDLGGDVLGQFRPGIALGVALAKDLDLSSGLPTGDLDVNRTNPFSMVELDLHAQVKDAVRAASVLEKVAAGSGALGFTVASRSEAGRKIFSSRYVAGEGMTWGLLGDSFVATGGKNAFAQASSRVAKAEPAFAIRDSRARAIFEGSASAIYLDVPALAAALRSVPESSYGVGGFRIKQVVESWTSMLDEVKGIAVGISVDDGGLLVDAELGLK